MSLTMEQLRRLATAIKENNLEEMDKVMQETINISFKPELIPQVCFLMACYNKLPALVSKYLSLRSFPTDRLYEAVEISLRGIEANDKATSNSLDVFKILMNTGKIDPYWRIDERNYIFPHSKQEADPKSESLALIDFIIKAGNIDTIKFLLSIIDINKKYYTFQGEVTPIYASVHRPEIMKFLLEKGADPDITCHILFKSKSSPTRETQPITFSSYVLIDGKSHQVYTEWLAEKAQQKNKLTDSQQKTLESDPDFQELVKKYEKKLLLDKKISHLENDLVSLNGEMAQINSQIVRAGGQVPQSAHSSGSNSPMSLGSKDNSPNSSPPRSSAIVQKTPPDSPVASRSVTPPGSPMHTSDNNSSGSAGSSPSSSNDTKPRIVLKVDKSLPKDKFEKRFYTRISPDTPIEQLKEYYFSGVTLDWYAPDHGGNAFHRAAEFRSNFPVAEAMLEWGVDINIKDLYGRTTVQRLAISEFEQWLSLECLEFVFKDRPHIKKKPDIDYQDRDGNTALHLAAAKGADEIIDWLLKHGANARLTNVAGLTAEQYADKCENLEKRTSIKTKLRPYSVQQSQSVMRSPAEIQYRSQPASSSNFANSSSGIFANNSASIKSPVPEPLLPQTRSAAQTVGALYAPPPSNTVELPKRPEPQPSSNAKKSSSVTGIFKKVFGK